MKKTLLICMVFCSVSLSVLAQKTNQKTILAIAERVFDWQQANPTGINLWEWHYGTYYSGLIDLYKVDPKVKYLQAMYQMGKQYHWKLRPRPYDANVFAIAQMYIDLYSITGNPEMIDNTRYCLDANFERHPVEPDVTFTGNRYWHNWWSWCDALYMAPPAYAKFSRVSGDKKYLEKMDELWTITHNYLYDKEEHLYFRDDNFFSQKTPTGAKVFWSRGNGWVMGGLAKVLQEIPSDFKNRRFYENLFQEMAAKIITLQHADGYWSVSLLDPLHFGGVETSGTAFFCYALAYGINSGLLEKEKYQKSVFKAWQLLVKNVNSKGRLGYVQQVGHSPGNVSPDDSEAYGSGAFLLAASEMYKLVKE
ncbi:MAG: glycoside hydrolase family 88 protein [Bacteroidales bacterium]